MKVHVRHIMKKLNATNRTHAAFLVHQHVADATTEERLQAAEE